MSYATASDIQSEFKSVEFSTNTSVTLDEITAFINQQEASINASLSKLYEVPIANADDILVIQSIVIRCVKARVSTILETKSPSKETDQEPAWMIMYREAKAELKRIVTGIMPLPNTPLLTENAGFAAYDYSAEADKNLPVFKRGVTQW